VLSGWSRSCATGATARADSTSTASDCAQVTLEVYRQRTGATGSVGLDRRGSLSIQPFEGSRFVRGGRYGISIDFSLEVVEKKNICGASFKSKFIDLTMKPRLDRVMVTRDRPFCKTRDAGVLFVCTSRISDAACFEHAIASAAEAASFKRANRKKSRGKSCRQSRRRVEARIEMPRCRTRKTSDYPPQLCVG
jgi:hypothetical protein